MAAPAGSSASMSPTMLGTVAGQVTRKDQGMDVRIKYCDS